MEFSKRGEVVGDMILLDNNFSSIISGIETGRLLSDIISKKVAIYLLPGGKSFNYLEKKVV
jgi:hypothetical protein